MADKQKALLFFNPKSGHSKAEQHRDLIRKHFSDHNIDLETIIVPIPEDEIKDIIDSAIATGVNYFLAAGGDGTVSMISTHLVGKDIPVGILPLGTGNLLAKTLHVPQKLEPALELITSDEHEIVKMDTFKLNDRFFLMNVSVGVSSKVMESVDSEQKQQMGFFAYLFNFFQQIFGLKLHRIFVDCDHQKTSYLASEILITNIGTAGVDPLTWSEDISFTDGIMDLLIFRAANLWDILGLVVSIFTKKGKFNPEVKFLKVNEYCRIDSPSPLQVQADGDLIGETPFEIEINPGSLSIFAGNDHQTNKHEGDKHENI